MNPKDGEGNKSVKGMIEPLIEKSISIPCNPKGTNDEEPKRKVSKSKDSPPGIIEYLCCCLLEPTDYRSEREVE